MATSTLRTYRAGVNRYISFCFAYNVSNPFPVSESTLCYFVVSLAKEGLASSTIKTYLAAVRHGQIERGFPDLREGSWLHMIQNGVRRERAERGPPQALRLPITPPIFLQMKRALISSPVSYDAVLVWAAVVTCFFDFFRAGEITVPAEITFDPAIHLAWGDVSMDGGSPPSKVRVFFEAFEDGPIRKGRGSMDRCNGRRALPCPGDVGLCGSQGDWPRGLFFVLKVVRPLLRTVLWSGCEGHWSGLAQATPVTASALAQRQQRTWKTP